jgi:hypothetical protein
VTTDRTPSRPGRRASISARGGPETRKKDDMTSRRRESLRSTLAALRRGERLCLRRAILALEELPLGDADENQARARIREELPPRDERSYVYLDFHRMVFRVENGKYALREGVLAPRRR